MFVQCLRVLCLTILLYIYRHSLEATDVEDNQMEVDMELEVVDR